MPEEKSTTIYDVGDKYSNIFLLTYFCTHNDHTYPERLELTVSGRECPHYDRSPMSPVPSVAARVIALIVVLMSWIDFCLQCLEDSPFLYLEDVPVQVPP